MIKWAWLIWLVLHVNSLHGKLLFEAGSDVGYILPDTPYDEESGELEAREARQYLQEEEVKNQVKRAFWNTVFDELPGVRNDETFSFQDPNSLPLSGTRRSKGDLTLLEPPEHLKDPKHGVVMGVPDHRCDDAKTDLEVDWDGSPVNYTCYTPKRRAPVRFDLSPVETCDDVPPHYIPQHFCMSRPIHYNTTIPTFGPHRPLWPVFGEYQFVPTQRWLHSIEHGSVVMLYHPCTAPVVVRKLKKIVRGCIYKHVISASNLVSYERPLTLLAWGCKLEMSFVDEAKVVSFIRARALKGPEGDYTKQGNYSLGLLHASKPLIGSGLEDSNLCPSY